jgi:hypothetical protein
VLEGEALHWNEREMQCLTIGGLVVTACFFAGQNINYRGIYFLLVLSGLVRQRGSADGPAIRQFLRLMIAAVLFVMWEEPLRRALHAIVAPVASSGLGSRTEVFFWIGRELVWWWLIAGLAAIVLSYLANALGSGILRKSQRAGLARLQS